MDTEHRHTFYRVTKRNPPDAEFYLTNQDRFPEGQPDGLSEEGRLTWDAWSFYDSEENARKRGLESTHLGGKIVRFHIPEGRGITWEPPDDEGHVNVRGDKERLEGCLDKAYVVKVRP